jgi:serine/alanine adding enzyme
MHVVRLTPDREKDWQRFVEDFPQTALAHTLGWRNVVEKTYHHVPFYLMAIDGPEIAGILPLFLIRSPFFGRLLATAPYLSFGGLVAGDKKAARALVHAAQEVAKEQRAKYVEIRGLQQVGHGLDLKNTYCTLVLPLTFPAEALWAQFEARARKAVRKALRSGLSVVRGHHLVGGFAEVLSRHMRDLGTPFHREIFYRNIVAELPDQVEILMVHQNGEYLGGLLLVTSKDTIFPLYGGVLTKYRVFSAMSLLIWETIRYGCEKGFARLDFGRSRWDSGTALFKRQWGARPFPLFYEYYLPVGTNLPDQDPTNPRFRLAITLWKRLPIFAARMLGPLIIRDIP